MKKKYKKVVEWDYDLDYKFVFSMLGILIVFLIPLGGLLFHQPLPLQPTWYNIFGASIFAIGCFFGIICLMIIVGSIREIKRKVYWEEMR